ncbi:MAG: hypothetical protein DRP11_04570 [Candidatus Aenigmatarchaeota archaeon]|nr:MAG: hypothetical protein DRP11_04570 [Candidatus Aenigmarchaeota archaeon]
MYRISIPGSNVNYRVLHADEVVDKVKELVLIGEGKIKIENSDIVLDGGVEKVKVRCTVPDETVDRLSEIAEIKEALKNYGEIVITYKG